MNKLLNGYRASQNLYHGLPLNEMLELSQEFISFFLILNLYTF